MNNSVKNSQSLRSSGAPKASVSPKSQISKLTSKRTLKNPLNIQTFIKTIRRGTDLAHRIDWGLLSNE